KLAEIDGEPASKGQPQGLRLIRFDLRRAGSTGKWPRSYRGRQSRKALQRGWRSIGEPRDLRVPTNERTISHGIKPPELDASVGAGWVFSEPGRGNRTPAGFDATPADQ